MTISRRDGVVYHERLALELFFRNPSRGLGGGLGTNCHHGLVFGLPFSSAGLFLDSLCPPRACFWTPFVLSGPVFGLPLSSAGLFLDSLCPPRACFWIPFVFCGPAFGLQKVLSFEEVSTPQLGMVWVELPSCHNLLDTYNCAWREESITRRLQTCFSFEEVPTTNLATVWFELPSRTDR